MSEKIVVYFEVFLIQLIDLKISIKGRKKSSFDYKCRNTIRKIVNFMLEDENMKFSLKQFEKVWSDNGLRWDKNLYGGVDDIRLPIHRIWAPDIVLYNYADTRLEEKREVLAIVSSDGKVRWRPSGIFKSTCQINIERFPYDDQTCHMKFGSWTYDGESIDIQFLDKQEVNTDLYINSNEWEIISTSGSRNEKKYECCLEIYPDITYEIKMKRKGGFYNYILVLPCVILSFLTTIVFWLPPESPAKMSIGMNIFTSFFVLFLLLSKNVPSSTDKIPLIGAYCCLNMLMIAISTCACTVVVHIFFRGEGQVPYIIRKIFLEFLARILCMFVPPVLPSTSTKRAKKLHQNQIASKLLVQSYNMNGNILNSIHRSDLNYRLNHNSQNNSLNGFNQQLSKLNGGAKCFSSQQNLEEPNRLHLENLAWKNRAQTTQCNEFSLHAGHLAEQNPPQLVYSHIPHHRLHNEIGVSFSLLESDIREIRDYLRHSRKKLQVADSKNEHANEWKQVALVLDRTLFFLYIIAIVISIFVMFPI